jgi:hypothetical protein
MQIALIPPIPDLRRMPRTGIHLLLSHLLKDERYTAFYKKRRTEGDYLILDNSAHEKGIGEVDGNLFDKALSVQAQEVVLPDVLFDKRGTIQRTQRTLKWLTKEGWETYVRAGRPRLMVVPQSGDRAEWSACLRILLQTFEMYSDKAPEAFAAPVVGISKDYDTWRNGLPKLIEDYVEPLRADYEFDVHCLGWPNNLWAVATISREFPWVRSTDSAKPFVYAKNLIQLEPGGRVPRYPRRDTNYFTESLNDQEWDIALRNCLVYGATAVNDLILA